MDSLALRLASSPSQAPTGRLPAPPLSQLHGERAISMVSTFQLTRSTRLTLTHPTEADAEQEVLFVSAEAAASTGPNAGLEIARGGRHIIETPVLGPTLWGLKGGGDAPAIRPGRAERSRR